MIFSITGRYYGELQANAALFELTEKIDVPPLKVDGLALVLGEPARVLGVGFESEDLVNHVVKSAEDQPGALPLLADLFTDLWERMRERADGILRVSDRREIIQVGAALCKRADRFLAEAPDQVEAVRRLFTLRLAHVPRQGEPVRARTRNNHLVTVPADPRAMLRSRPYLMLLVLAAIIGVVVSAVAWGYLALVSYLQKEIFTHLPHGLGFHAEPVWWPLPVLAVGGVIAALGIEYLPGRGGPSPAGGNRAAKSTTASRARRHIPDSPGALGDLPVETVAIMTGPARSCPGDAPATGESWRLRSALI